MSSSASVQVIIDNRNHTVMSSDNSPKSDGNPAASPPAPEYSNEAKNNQPEQGKRNAGKSRRSMSDIPEVIDEHSPSVPPFHFVPGSMPSSFHGSVAMPPGSYTWGVYGASPHHPQYSHLAGPPGHLPLGTSQAHPPFPIGGQQSRSAVFGQQDPSNKESGVDPNPNFYGHPYLQQPAMSPHVAPMMYAGTSPHMWQQQFPHQQPDTAWQQQQYPTESQELLPPNWQSKQQQQQRQGQEKHDGQRRARRTRSHRKAHSSSAAVPGAYGSFWNDPNQNSTEAKEASTPNTGIAHQSVKSATGSLGRNQGLRFMQNAVPPIGSSGTRFSPRNELRKMFKELSPVQAQRKGASANNLNASTRGVASPRIQYSPNSTPKVYPSGMTATMRLPSPGQVIGTGGEAAMIFKGVPSKESNRKKHQRQQSAQQFMEQIKGVDQPLKCRNVSFLLLFVFHLLFVGVYLGEKFIRESVSTLVPVIDPDIIKIYYHNLIFVATLSGAFAIVSSTLLLACMTFFARKYLQISLIIVITLSFIWGTLGVGLSPKTVVPVTGIIALGFAVAYTFIVWDRIPFHATNLLSALSGIRVFPSTVILATCLQIIILSWFVYFSVVVAGFYNAVQEGKVQISKKTATVCYILLGLSFYWTYQVTQGCVKAATAGVIAGWWHTPEYSAQVRDSCFKTMFYSIGSICLGGLLIGPVTVMRQLSILVRPSQSEQSLLCLHECMHFIQTVIFNAVDFLVIRCNDYSFTYIGIYHYGFFEAGYNATELFEKRGWTTIVSDDLIQNVLFLTSLVMGGVTGCFAHFISQIYNLSLTTVESPGMASFLVGSVIGLVLSSIVFSVVSSSVNTVLVCFASSPVDFETNHPALSTEMRGAWREVWPGALDINPQQYLTNQNDSDEMSPLV